jgi:hypothetical protein
MDSAVFWVSVVSAVAAVAAAIFGWLQASTARKARDDARRAGGAAVQARDAAVKAQQDSAAAADRIAGVLEQQAEERRAAAEKRTVPWQAQPGSYRKTGTAIVLVNISNHVLSNVSMDVERRPYVVLFDPSPVPDELQPGDSVEVYWARAGGDPGTSTLVIRWRWSDSDEVHTTRVPLTR